MDAGFWFSFCRYGRVYVHVTTRRDNDRLEEYVWSFVFRMNARPLLLQKLGHLAKKANKGKAR